MRDVADRLCTPSPLRALVLPSGAAIFFAPLERAFRPRKARFAVAERRDIPDVRTVRNGKSGLPNGQLRRTMGRYTGAKHRISRRFAENIWGYKKTPLATRPYKPGQHGRDGRKKKLSTYGEGLNEKQKLKFYYQLRERSFRRLFDKAMAMPGNTGDNLMQLLERRLDNVVYRLGFAPTPRAARQLVAHGHISVNGRKVDRASYTVDIGDKVAVREKSRQHLQVQEAVAQKPQVVSYLQANPEKLEGELLQIPKRDDIPMVVNERAVVEFLGR